MANNTFRSVSDSSSCSLMLCKFPSRSWTFSDPFSLPYSNRLFSLSNFSLFLESSSTSCWSSYRFLLILSYFFLIAMRLWCADSSSMLSTCSGSLRSLLRSRVVAKERSPYLYGEGSTWCFCWGRWGRVVWRLQSRYRWERSICCAARSFHDDSSGWSR